MKKIIIALLLSLASFNLLAEWIPVGENEDGLSATFIDLKTLRKSGDSAEVWSVVVFVQPREIHGKKILSLRELDEFDCKQKRFRTIALFGHWGKMAVGPVLVADFVASGWNRVSSKTIAEQQWKMVCK